jgi:hypothetical protein
MGRDYRSAIGIDGGDVWLGVRAAGGTGLIQYPRSVRAAVLRWAADLKIRRWLSSRLSVLRAVRQPVRNAPRRAVT